MLPRGRDLRALRSQIEVRELDEGFNLAPRGSKPTSLEP